MNILSSKKIKINGKTHGVVACESMYAPQFRTSENKYTAFVAGNVLNSFKSVHATPEAAISAAEELVKKFNGAFFPTVFGDAPYL